MKYHNFEEDENGDGVVGVFPVGHGGVTVWVYEPTGGHSEDQPACGLVPGWMEPTWAQEEIAREVADAGFLAFQIRYGHTHHPANLLRAEETRSMQVHVAVREVANAFGVDDVVLYGHSQGGGDAARMEAHNLNQPPGKRLPVQGLIYDATPNLYGEPITALDILRTGRRELEHFARYPVDQAELYWNAGVHVLHALRQYGVVLPVREAVVTARKSLAGVLDEIGEAPVYQFAHYQEGDELIAHGNMQAIPSRVDEGGCHMSAYHDPQIPRQLFEELLEHL